MLLALCTAVSVSIIPSSASAAAYVSSANYTIERIDRSLYDPSGSLKLSQYFDKVVLTDSSDNARRINELITRESDAFLADAQGNIDMVAEYPPSEPYSNNATAEVTNNSDGILSIKMTADWYMGGVYNTNVYGLNYNLNAGEELELTDVFSLSVNEIENYLKSQTIEYMNNNPNMGWWNDVVQNAWDIVNSKTLDEFDYYIQGDNIFICYPEYELGPGAMGRVVIQCPIIRDEEIKVVLNGSEIQFDQPPIMRNDRVMVPLRAIFEVLGYNVIWHDITQTATASNGSNTIIAQINNPNILYDQGTYVCDVSPTLVSDRTLVPVRAVSECAGCAVDWNEESNTVIITSGSSDSSSGGSSGGGSSSSGSSGVTKARE